MKSLEQYKHDINFAYLLSVTDCFVLVTINKRNVPNVKSSNFLERDV